MTHFVYPYIIPKNPAFGWELMYSIRSIYQNFKGDFDITVIGEIPEWLKTNEVNSILFDNNDPKKLPRVQSRTNQKFLLAAELYPDMVIMHDDYYLINKCDESDFKKIRRLSETLKYSPDHENKLTRFQKQIRWTYFKLKDLGKRYNYNFCTHAPFYYQSDRLKEIHEVFNLTSGKEHTIITENAYYNYFNCDSEIIGDFRVGYWGESDKKITSDTKILNHDERGFFHHPWIISLLNGLFPNRSPAEK
jgi:hypothetical protein